MKVEVRSSSQIAVSLIHLLVERAEIIQPAEAENSASQEPDDTAWDFSKIESVDAEYAEKHLEQPGDGVVESPGGESTRRLFFHGGNEEKIDDPANEKQATGEEPDDSGDWFSEVKAVNPDEAEDPHEVAEAGAVGGCFRGRHASRVVRKF